MKKLLKDYIQCDIDFLTNKKNLGIKEKRALKKSIKRLISINKELEELLDSNIHLNTLLIKHNNKKKSDLKEILYKMNPYKFELLVAKLFNAMGYNAKVTKKSNDLGVDIVAKGKIGLTPIKEIIQVKRQKNNIHRPTLDQLRGVIPLHNATTGTIVTLSDFSQNCYNLAPKNIKLINGDKLINLLFKYQVGFSSISIEVYKVDFEFLGTLSS